MCGDQGRCLMFSSGVLGHVTICTKMQHLQAKTKQARKPTRLRSSHCLKDSSSAPEERYVSRAKPMLSTVKALLTLTLLRWPSGTSQDGGPAVGGRGKHGSWPLSHIPCDPAALISQHRRSMSGDVLGNCHLKWMGFKLETKSSDSRATFQPEDKGQESSRKGLLRLTMAR